MASAAQLVPAAEIRAHAQDLYQQAVVLKLMPMNNATQITDTERAALGRWYEAGAPAYGIWPISASRWA